MTSCTTDSELASFAFQDADSAGRQHPESAHPYRGPFQRDRDRIVHSSAFRRLAHKTQVFTGHLGDYHRSRLTHTLEVASIARTIGRALKLNEDLIEALALMHDIGHPPFGHAGEEVLDQCSKECGGFNHNAHAVRIVTLLEHRYPEFPGLNLTSEVIAGQSTRLKNGQASAEQPLLEVQVVDAADSIAYDSHDADDALELGLLNLEELLDVPLWCEAAGRVRQRYTSLEPEPFRRAVIHQLIETLVSDLIEATQSRLSQFNIECVQNVKNCDEALVHPSSSFASQKAELEQFLFQKVYRHPTVLAERRVACQALELLFERHRKQPERLPLRFQQRSDEDGVDRAICDYLASITDRFALESSQDLAKG